MKLIIDECLAKSTILILKKAGFKIINVEEILEPSIEDDKIFEYAVNHKLPIITHDRGFGLLYRLFQSIPPTIIILQVLSPHPEATNNLLNKFLSKFDINQPKYYGKLIIVTENNIRIRSK
jgi:predicted nuclease of predicted toxin-antitoxin system